MELVLDTEAHEETVGLLVDDSDTDVEPVAHVDTDGVTDMDGECDSDVDTVDVRSATVAETVTVFDVLMLGETVSVSDDV